jgi:hypothetical protein
MSIDNVAAEGEGTAEENTEITAINSPRNIIGVATPQLAPTHSGTDFSPLKIT